VASAPGRITPHRAPPSEELDLKHEFAHLFSGKSTKTAATRAALCDSIMHQFVCWLGIRPRPHRGSLQSGLKNGGFLKRNPVGFLGFIGFFGQAGKSR